MSALIHPSMHTPTRDSSKLIRAIPSDPNPPPCMALAPKHGEMRESTEENVQFTRPNGNFAIVINNFVIRSADGHG
eukprot:5262603-Pleurochrysis_carterae.AAC.5